MQCAHRSQKVDGGYVDGSYVWYIIFIYPEVLGALCLRADGKGPSMLLEKSFFFDEVRRKLFLQRRIETELNLN